MACGKAVHLETAAATSRAVPRGKDEMKCGKAGHLEIVATVNSGAGPRGVEAIKRGRADRLVMEATSRVGLLGKVALRVKVVRDVEDSGPRRAPKPLH